MTRNHTRLGGGSPRKHTRALAIAAVLLLSPAAGHANPSSGAGRYSRLAEKQLIEECREAARRQVEALVARRAGLPGGPEADRILESIVEIKMNAWIHRLEIQRSFAVSRGDHQTAREAEKALDRLIHPRAPEPPDHQQTSDKREMKGAGR